MLLFDPGLSLETIILTTFEAKSFNGFADSTIFALSLCANAFGIKIWNTSPPGAASLRTGGKVKILLLLQLCPSIFVYSTFTPVTLFSLQKISCSA